MYTRIFAVFLWLLYSEGLMFDAKGALGMRFGRVWVS